MNKRKSSCIAHILDDSGNDLKIKKIKADFINYITVPSLESIAIASIITELCKHADFKEEMGKLLLHYYYMFSVDKDKIDKKVLQILKNISKKLYLLSLPNLLKERARYAIRPMGLEIVNWIRTFGIHSRQRQIIDTVFWTVNGTIDRAKTCAFYIANENFHPILIGNVQQIFNRACEYCLEDHIANLWEQIPKRRQEYIIDSQDIYQGYNGHLIAYWICFTQNKLPKLMSMIKPSDVKNIYSCSHSIYRNMFTLSVAKNKALAVKYFWNFLTDEEKSESIIFWTCLSIEELKVENNEHTDVMCFLLSQIHDRGQQIEVFKKYPMRVLNSLFFSYPWRKFLLPTIQLMWDFLDSGVYIHILLRFIEEIGKTGFTGAYFIELWCNSPMKFKTKFIQHITNCNYSSPIEILWNLFDIGDIETIKLILKDANVHEKKTIIFSSLQSDKLFRLIYTEKLYLFDMLIEEGGVSENKIKYFKEQVVLKHGNSLCCYWIHDDNWQAVEKFLYWGFTSRDEVHTFKMKIANRIVEESSLGILGSAKWSTFETFLNWCFNTDEEINKFKMDLSPFKKLESCIFHIIVYGYNFEFADKFLVWCLPSEKEISQFKNQLMLSPNGIDMFYRFVSDDEVYSSEYSHTELVKKLMKWFHPCKKVLIEFKDIFKNKYFFLYGGLIQIIH